MRGVGQGEYGVLLPAPEKLTTTLGKMKFSDDLFMPQTDSAIVLRSARGSSRHEKLKGRDALIREEAHNNQHQHQHRVQNQDVYP